MGEVKKVFRMNSISEIRHIKVNSHDNIDKIKKAVYPRIESKIKEKYKDADEHQREHKDAITFKMTQHYKKYDKAVQNLEEKYENYTLNREVDSFIELIDACNTAIISLAELDMDISSTNIEMVMETILGNIVQLNGFGIDMYNEIMVFDNKKIAESIGNTEELDIVFKEIVAVFRHIYDTHQVKKFYEMNLANNLVGVLIDKKY